MPSSIKLKDIRIDGGTQSRTRLNERHIQHLLEVLEDDGRLEPIEVIYDGTDYWLWDGFHRVEAYRQAKRTSIPAHIDQGTQRDAILKSCGANGKHGLPRSNADKRRAVTRVLSDPEWSKWSDREIARQCAVSHPYVANLRTVVTVNVTSEERVYTTKHGTVSTMNVAPIIEAHKTTPPDPVVTPTPVSEEPNWATLLQPVMFYLTHPQQRTVYGTAYDNIHVARREGDKGTVPQRGAYIITSPIFKGYHFVVQPSADDSTPLTTGDIPANEGQALHPTGIDDSTSPDEPAAPALTILPEKWYPIKHTEKAVYCDPFDKQSDGIADPRYQGHAIQKGRIILDGMDFGYSYANYQIVSPKEQPRHDPREVSNAGPWTPNETAYLNRSQTVVNRGHAGKMPYVGKPLAGVPDITVPDSGLPDLVRTLREQIRQLETENEALRSENIRLKAEVVGLRVKVQPSVPQSTPVERIQQ